MMMMADAIARGELTNPEFRADRRRHVEDALLSDVCAYRAVFDGSLICGWTFSPETIKSLWTALNLGLHSGRPRNSHED